MGAGVSPRQLQDLLHSDHPPLVIDVRRSAAYLADSGILAGALRRDSDRVGLWAGEFPHASAVIVYCVHGHEVSQGVAGALERVGISAHYLEGGLEAWKAVGGGLSAKPTGASTRWVTRERPKIDRIACPWLIARLIDAEAQFLYVPAGSVLHAATIDWPLLLKIGGFFAEAGAFVFGSGLAIVPFLYGGVVNEDQWLNERQFVEAVAVAMITPGPLVITVGFIGCLVAGFPGAVVAALGTFLPCYFFTIIPAPYFKKHGKHPGIVAFVDGVTAAAIGTITGAVVVIGKRSITDVSTALLALVTVALIWKFKKLPQPVIVPAAALIGLVVYPITKP